MIGDDFFPILAEIRPAIPIIDPRRTGPDHLLVDIQAVDKDHGNHAAVAIPVHLLDADGPSVK